MKKFLYFAIIAAGCIVTSCDDMLTVKSPDTLTPENFWRNKSDVEKTLASSYAMLESATDYYGFSETYWTVEAYREDLFELGADAFNYPEWVELYNFTYTNGNPKFSTYWANCYRGINRANQVISKTPNISSKELSDNDKTELTAEAKFLRGYFHLKLLLNWEKIVIRDTYIQTEAEFHKSLSSRSEAWDFIIADLQEATKMPNKRNAETVGRATSGAAYSYLGYAYLTRAYEETAKKEEYLKKAIEAFDQVKGYGLEKDFLSMFDGTNKNSSESIFEIQFSSNTENGAGYTTTLHKWIASSELTGWDEILPNEKLVNEYKKEGKIATTGRYDSRLYATIYFQDPYFNDPKNPRVYGYTYDEWFVNEDGQSYNKPSFRKYLPKTMADLKNEGSSINVVLMRYANVLLMKAEAYNELGHPELAIPLINEVRERADMPKMTGQSQTEVRAQIEHERILEFPLENFRFYDLRRWGKAKQALEAIGRTGFSNEKNSFYPIPQTELNTNNALSKK